MLDELFKTATKSNFLALIPILHLIHAELSLSEGNLSQATSASNEAIKAGGPKSEIAIQAQYILGLVKATSRSESQKLCEESMKDASNAGDFGLHSRALLACAEVALKGNDPQTALTLATQAQERFSRGVQFESEWRAWMIASRASKMLGDSNKAQEQIRNAEAARSKLEQQWGAEAFKQYSGRPDIQVYYR